MEDQKASAWARYAQALAGTPLFLGIGEGEIAAFLKALSPEVKHGVLHPVSEGGAVDRFYLVVGSEALGDGRKPRFTYGMPELGQPGSITGAIPSFSCKDEHLLRTPPEAKDPYPDLSCEALVMTPDMLTGDLGPDIAQVQLKVLRNMAGILAQKAVDARRKLYMKKAGVDIYSAEYSADGLSDKWL